MLQLGMVSHCLLLRSCRDVSYEAEESKAIRNSLLQTQTALKSAVSRHQEAAEQIQLLQSELRVAKSATVRTPRTKCISCSFLRCNKRLWLANFCTCCLRSYRECMCELCCCRAAQESRPTRYQSSWKANKSMSTGCSKSQHQLTCPLCLRTQRALRQPKVLTVLSSQETGGRGCQAKLCQRATC